MSRSFLLMFIFVHLHCSVAVAQPDGFAGVTAERKWTVLHLRNNKTRGVKPLPDSAKVSQLKDLAFTGPKPGHQFILGNYAADGEWGFTNGYLQRQRGKNAALQLCWADQFELEGIVEHAEFGGWFMLVGWDKGHGYSISNVKLKTSGSPWFVSEMRGNKSIEEQTIEFDHFNWKGQQPFRLSVKDNELSLVVGRVNVLSTPLKNYKPGMIVIGVYDTDYGPKSIRVQSLRVRSISSKK